MCIAAYGERMAKCFRLGAIGTGHWFDRLYSGIIHSGRINVSAVAGARDFSRKAAKLSQLGVSERDYYQITGVESIPAEFFAKSDIVHISTPNAYHESQTLQSLDHSRIVVTEKSFATSERGFDTVLRTIAEKNWEKNTYLHLHYAHKTLTTSLPKILSSTEPKHGRITSFTATFFEDVSKVENANRLWIFKREHGGIFMDWIHPFEVLLYGAGANSFDLLDAKNIIVNHNYSNEWPTGILSQVKARGEHFADDCVGNIRVGMGLPHGGGMKQMSLTLESGAVLQLDFVGAETEAASSNRGNWRLYSRSGKNASVLASGTPIGPSPSEVFADYILRMCDGIADPLDPAVTRALFAPQWVYQKRFADVAPLSSKEDVTQFLSQNGAAK